VIVFDASAVVSAALRENSVPERALLRAEETDIFALSAEVDAEIAGVLGRPGFAAAISRRGGRAFSTCCMARRCGSARPSA
jgi:predicted nucleic acid-binding protein